MSALGPSGSNGHGLGFPQSGGTRRNPAFCSPDATRPNKWSPATHSASPYQTQTYPAQQQPPQAAFHQRRYNLLVYDSVFNGASMTSGSHPHGGLSGVPRQRAAPPMQQMPLQPQGQQQPLPIIFPSAVSQPVPHGPIIAHQQQQRQAQQQHQWHPAHQTHPSHPSNHQTHPQHQSVQGHLLQSSHPVHPSHQAHQGHPAHSVHSQQQQPPQPSQLLGQQQPPHQQQQQRQQSPHYQPTQQLQPPQAQQQRHHHHAQQQHHQHQQQQQAQAAHQHCQQPQQLHQHQPPPPLPSQTQQQQQPQPAKPPQAPSPQPEPISRRDPSMVDDVDMDNSRDDDDANSIGAKLLNDPSEKNVPTQPMKEIMSLPPEGGSYPTLEALQKAVLRQCTSVGYAIVIGRSKKTVHGLKKVLFVCDRAGKPPNLVSPESRKRKTSSRKCDCPFGFFAIEQKTQWTIRYRPDPAHLQHNHGPSEGPSHHPAARKLDNEMVAAVKERKESGAGVTEILRNLQSENPDCHLLPRDIYNARAAISRNPQKVQAGLAENRPSIYTKPPQTAEDRTRSDLRRELSKARDAMKKMEEEKRKQIGRLKARVEEQDGMIKKFEMFVDICNQRVMVQRERLSSPDLGLRATGASSGAWFTKAPLGGPIKASSPPPSHLNHDRYRAPQPPVRFSREEVGDEE